MTTQPVSSSPSSSSSPYDVFLSFRGEDTRTNFTDHLHEALVLKGIQTFIDGELVRGEEISPALVKAIEESRISVIVFSENYASSRWCLDELVKILQCKQSKQQIVLPIFYKVDPSDVRKQTNSFGDAFKGLIQSKFKDDKQIQGWRKALTEAANLSGWHFEEGGYEATFINNIVDGIFNKLPPTYLYVAKYLVGIQSHVQDVEMLLDVGGNGRCMVGIWGTSGIGKTTIAKAIFNAVSHKFGGNCFLENVREGSLVQLQKTLLQEILGGKKLEIASADKGISIIHKLLRHKKILLILDDVDRLEQLEKLAGDDWFGEGSRVIITTKNRRLLNNRKIELIYEVKKLDYNQALELFSWHAFGRSEPPKDYLELAQRAIAFADGLPLALAILGSHLRGIDIQSWDVILDSYEGEPYTHIEIILQKSYDALDHRAKEYFLDIACFFKGEYEDYVLQMVPKKFIEEFVDKALITIEWSKILMHDLRANLGKDIVHKESPKDPGQRSRLWFSEDVKQVLMESTGTRNIKGIIVKLPEPEKITFNPECFRNMVNLEIFINRNASLCGHINYLPNTLRLIDWDRCQLQSLPPNFQGNHLVEFNMPHSHIRQLDGFNHKHLSKLTSMNLRGCQFLEKIPDLSGIPTIEYLNLRECTRLVEVDGSVGFLDKLVDLDLGGCVKLTRFGTTLRLKSLQFLNLRACRRLKSFPEIEVEMESLWSLDISGSGVRQLPPSIAYLTGLDELQADYCKNLTMTVNLPNLSELSLIGCNLSKINFLQPLDRLTEINLSGNNFVNLPISFSKCVNLRNLRLSDCRSLLEIPEQVLPPRIRFVLLDDCTSLEKIPKLAWVLLDNCTSLRKIPEISPGDDNIRLRLNNCFRLRGYDITENIFLNQVSVSSPHSRFEISLPGDEVPKWFSCCKDATIVGQYLSSGIGTKRHDARYDPRYDARCEVSFEIPPNLKWKTLRLVLCVVSDAYARILLNGKLVNDRDIEVRESHVCLVSIPLLDRYAYEFEEPLKKQGNTCQVILCLYSKWSRPVKIPCGVHLLGHQVADVSELSLSLASKTSLGKRPPHRANVVDIGDHGAQWLTLFTGPTDHQKRRHIDRQSNEVPNWFM
ncbi:hypothetical protein GBA52_005757 [Prunus armeniaca]|nr:hypothetical protein GBA52_005757 [Prunus armeniaca]